MNLNLGNIEKVENILLRPAKNLVIKNAVIVGKKSTKNQQKIDPIYVKSYSSNKYSDHSNLTTVSIETSDYLVFGFADIKESVFEEIYISYPHIERVINFFEKAYNVLQGNVYLTKDVKYGKDDKGIYEEKKLKTKIDMFIDKKGELYLNPKYSEYEMNLTNLIGGKSMSIMFDVIADENTQTEQKGIYLFMNSQDNLVIITEENIKGLLYFLKNYNLQLSSQNLLMMTVMMNNSSNGNSSPNSYPSRKGENVNDLKRRKVPARKIYSEGKSGEDMTDIAAVAESILLDDDELPFSESYNEESYDNSNTTTQSTTKKVVKNKKTPMINADSINDIIDSIDLEEEY